MGRVWTVWVVVCAHERWDIYALGGGVLLLVCLNTMLAHTQTTHQRHGSSLRSTPCAWSPLLGSSRLQTAPDQHLISRARRFLKYASTSPPRPPRRGKGTDERGGSLSMARTWCWTPQSCTESSNELHVSLAILLSASTFLCSASIGLSRASMCAYKCPCLLTFLPVTASIDSRWVAPGRWWSNDAWLMNVLAQT